MVIPAEISSTNLLPSLHKWQDWLANERSVAVRSQEIYRDALWRFIHFLQHFHGEAIDEKGLNQAKLTEFRAFLSYLRKEGLSARSVALHLAALRNYYAYLKQFESQNNHEIGRLKTPKYQKKLPRPISIEECLALIEEAADHKLAWIAARDRAIFALLYGCGLRISEVLALHTGQMPIGDQLKITGKGGKDRILPVLPRVQQLLAEYWQRLPYKLAADAPIFRGQRGGVLHAAIIQKRLRELRGILGLPPTATPHALRHSFATHLLGEDVDLRALAELLGHASLSTTQIYTQVDATKLGAIVANKHPRG